MVSLEVLYSNYSYMVLNYLIYNRATESQHKVKILLLGSLVSPQVVQLQTVIYESESVFFLKVSFTPYIPGNATQNVGVWVWKQVSLLFTTLDLLPIHLFSCSLFQLQMSTAGIHSSTNADSSTRKDLCWLPQSSLLIKLCCTHSLLWYL